MAERILITFRSSCNHCIPCSHLPHHVVVPFLEESRVGSIGDIIPGMEDFPGKIRKAVLQMLAVHIVEHVALHEEFRQPSRILLRPHHGNGTVSVIRVIVPDNRIGHG